MTQVRASALIEDVARFMAVPADEELERPMKVGLVWALLASLLCAGLSSPTQAQVTTRELQKPGGKMLPGLDVLEISSYQSGKQRYHSPFNNFSGDLDGALGPIFNATTCTSCHDNDGGDGSFLVTQFGHFDPATGLFDPLADFGGPVLQVDGNPGGSCALEVVPNGQTLDDGTVLPIANVIASRRTLGTQGYGLIEALSDDQILVNETFQSNLSEVLGISGRVHWSVPLEAVDGVEHAGRFGWKAQLSTVRSFTADASRNKLGLTNQFITSENLPNQPALESGFAADCEDQTTGMDPEMPVNGLFVETVTAFQRYMTGPPQSPRNGTSGENTFGLLGCAFCHMPSYVTSNQVVEEALRNVTIRPYTDFLLHQMVDIDETGTVTAGRGDGIVIYGTDGTVKADQHEIRTPALWGLRERELLMHDGSVDVTALGFDAAIREVIDLHRGEGNFSRLAFEAINSTDQQKLIDFLDTLGRLDFDFDDDGARDADDLAPALASLGVIDVDTTEAIADLDSNGIVDSTEVTLLFDQITPGGMFDNNFNKVEDDVDIALGLSEDLDLDGVPDEADASFDCDKDRFWRFGSGGTFPFPNGSGTDPLMRLINISGVSAPITDIRLTLTGLYHPWASHLNITLTQVRDGFADTTVTVCTDTEGNDSDFAGTYVFSDDGLLAVADSANLHPGTLIMREAVYTLSPTFSSTFAEAFAADGRSPNGQWILKIEDDEGGSTSGGLDSWTLEVTIEGSDQDDSDGDGVPDCADGCPDDPFRSEPGDCGCGNDNDDDGTCNSEDACPFDPEKTEPGICGCGAVDNDTDTDGDGVADCADECPEDPKKSVAGQCGCGTPETGDQNDDGIPDCIECEVDSDRDGMVNCIDPCPFDPDPDCTCPDGDSDGDDCCDDEDGCPDDPAKCAPGECGCGVPETGDSDGDGTHDCNDGCPTDPDKTEPGECGCGVPETGDSDGDGTSDCIDDCPDDPEKTEPGDCGCGVAETDTDEDGTPDCIDDCPDDPDKTEPGDCGCGVAETDTDEDGTPDCIDDCPDDPEKTEPGNCGCGVEDSPGCGQAAQWRVEDGGNGHWYQLLVLDDPTLLPGILANARGAHPATLVTLEESAWAFANIASDPMGWTEIDGTLVGPRIGLFNPCDGNWYWVTGEVFDWSGWAADEPSSGCGGVVLYAPDAGTGPQSTWAMLATVAPEGARSILIEWSADCNDDGIVDHGQILDGELEDADGSGIPDICEMPAQWATEEGGNGHWYQYDTTPFQQRDDARSAALAAGGDLVSITSSGEDLFVDQLIDVLKYSTNFDIFTGGYDADGQWAWSTGEAWSFTDWNDVGTGPWVEIVGRISVPSAYQRWGTAEDGGYMTSIVEWSADCNGDGIVDYGQIFNGTLTDTDGDTVPDDCDICPGHRDDQDADGDGVPDGCDLCPGEDDTVDSDSDGTPDCLDPCPDWPGDCSKDGQTLHVIEGESIQAAIDLCPDGGIVSIGPGTHTGTGDSVITMPAIGITIIGMAGAESTIIDGEDARRGLTGIGCGDNGTVIESLTFTNGLAAEGGGMYLEACSPTVRLCTFDSNESTTSGTVTGGGGAFILQSTSSFEQCLFLNNIAADDGGGICIKDSTATVSDCTFTGNSAQDGGGAHNNNSVTTFTNTQFDSNTATSDGGGLNTAFKNANATVNNCTFTANAANRGGGITVLQSTASIDGSTATGNSAGYGGGMANFESISVTLTNCTFDTNTAVLQGGGMLNETSASPQLTDCTFTGNSVTDGSGGGMDNDGSCNPFLANCVFTGNSARYGAGLHSYDNSNPTLTGCEFTDNTAELFGGGLRCDGGTAFLTDCIMTGNLAGTSGGGVGLYNGSILEVTGSRLCSNAPDQIDDDFTDNGGNCITATCDTDSDGTFDCDDNCPDDPEKTEPGECGCGVAETDTDKDDTPDCIDNCPEDPEKTEPGECGCGVAETDTDKDDTPDCIDNCPEDPEKTEPGDCGCGVAETDTDEDGTPDCIDNCPEDPEKTEPGDCGCGVAETDTDGDGTPDCNDDCPTWPGDCSDGGQTILVNLGDGLSIADAITAAPDGGTVVVGAGTWNEAIDFAGRAITIRAASGFGSGATVLDGTGLDTSIVTFANGEGAGSALQGFTLQNGTAGTDDAITGLRVGGALFTDGTAPTIIDCVFLDNESVQGGAVYLRGGAVTIQSCLFSGNIASDTGGALQVNGGTPTLLDTTIRLNIALNDGGGVNWLADGGLATIEGCTIIRNESITTDSGGINAVSATSALEISGTVVCNNEPGNLVGAFSDLGGNTLCVCLGDLDGDGLISGSDLSVLLGYWGPCDPDLCLADLDGNGLIDGGDLTILLGFWGACP
jgi:CxxC motif-containing protein (DUF1111 family)